jgi:hypothetical protein
MRPQAIAKETLWTLGQLIDAEQVTVRGIFENGNGFHLTSTAEGEPSNLRFTRKELRIINELRALLRRTG